MHFVGSSVVSVCHYTLHLNQTNLLLSDIKIYKKVKVCFYIAQYPVRWTRQNAYTFPPLADLLQPVSKIDHYYLYLVYTGLHNVHELWEYSEYKSKHLN